MIRTKLLALGSAALLISSALACSDDASDGSGGSGASASTGTNTTTGTSTGGNGTGGNSTTGTASGGGSAAGGGNAGGGSAAGGNGTGGEAPIVLVLCPAFNDPLECGDTIDNDSDGLIDWQDPECLGPCDDTENSFENGIPGDNNAPCKQECYFDSNTGPGNDGCAWDHRCDPYSVDPDFYPQPSRGDACEYDPAYQINNDLDCDGANAAQSQQCLDVCRPLLPNGCDCFGCCEIFIPNTTTSYTVWLGSSGLNGDTACGIEELADPDICHPCTQVPSCLNTCEECEICIGKPEPGPECNPGSGGGGQGGDGAGGGGGGSQCPPDLQACGLPGQPSCPSGTACITGCCLTIPE